MIKRSPLAPLAASVYGLGRPAAERAALLQNFRYDRQTVALMRRVLRQASSCIDIGAHEGDLLRHMVALAPGGRHVAFEPIPHLAAALRQQFPGVEVHQAACGEAAGQAQFVVVENAPAYSGLRERIYDRPDVALRHIPVTIVRVDEVVRHPVALVKVDVEGGEYHALRGAEGVLAEHRPLVVFEASARSTGQYGVQPEDFAAFFARLGYRIWTLDPWLAGQAPLEDEEFAGHWHRGSQYYFVACWRPR